jgi:hypothetical protein
MRISRFALVGIIAAALAMPGLAMAGGKGCQLQGTWFGVDSLEYKMLTGWMVTATGKSADHGTNNLEFPVFDPTLQGMFPDAVSLSSMRGAWYRTSGNTFNYSFMGFGLDAFSMPVYVGKVSGTVTVSENCTFETITADMAIYLPGMSPFEGPPVAVIPLDDHYGYRFTVD